jgi:hypothetical protein
MLPLIADTTQEIYVSNGIGIGAAIAIVCSWQRNRSIIWAIVAGILSWIYVVYFALTRAADEKK